MAEHTLYVLGNGFDLAHSLPTRFVDFFFFLEALAAYSRIGEVGIRGVKIGSIYPNQPMYDDLLFSLVARECPPYLARIIRTLHLDDSTRENFWHCYFRDNLQQNTNTTWIDFETSIYKLISRLVGIKDSSHYLKDIERQRNGPPFTFPRELSSLASLVASAGREGLNTHFPSLKKETVRFLYEELLRYSFSFELYLQFYVLHLAKQRRVYDPIKKIFDKHNSLFVPENQTAVLSFNYTNTLSLIYQDVKTAPTENKIFYIHGKVRDIEDLTNHMDDPDFQLSTPLILGYHNTNTDPDLDSKPFMWFEKFYQRILNGARKPTTEKTIYDWIESLDQDVYEDPHLNVIIYGHSLDSSDADLINTIFSVATHVDIYYHDVTALPDLITNLATTLGKEKLEEDVNAKKIDFILIGSICPTKNTTPDATAVTSPAISAV